jgi:hypothetical protein
MLAPADDDRLLGEISKSAANVGLRLTAVVWVCDVERQLQSKAAVELRRRRTSAAPGN